MYHARARAEAKLEAQHGKFIMAVAYSPDGEYLAAGSADGAVTLFDSNTGRRITAFTHSMICWVGMCMNKHWRRSPCRRLCRRRRDPLLDSNTGRRMTVFRTNMITSHNIVCNIICPSLFRVSTVIRLIRVSSESLLDAGTGQARVRFRGV